MFNSHIYRPAVKKSEKKDHTHEELLYSYERIHSYIMHNDSLILQMLGFTLTIVTAALAFSLQASTTYIYRIETMAALTGLVAISATQTFRRVRRTFEMATYLRIKIEPHLANIQWETDLNSYRMKRSGKVGNLPLNDFQQAAVFLAYTYILASTVALTTYYAYRLYSQTAKHFIIHWQLNIDWQSDIDRQLNLTIFSLLLCIVVSVIIFCNTRMLRVEINGKIEKKWKEVFAEKNK